MSGLGQKQTTRGDRYKIRHQVAPPFVEDVNLFLRGLRRRRKAARNGDRPHLYPCFFLRKALIQNDVREFYPTE
jgi:hypothetical protein